MRLVLQAKHIQPSHLMHLHQLAGMTRGQQFMQIGAHAYYLPGQTTRSNEVLSFCVQQQIECHYVDDHHTLSNFKLAVMDMDSTLISIECIDEIADMMQLKPQISAITESAMRGEIDFTQSLKQRVSLLAGLDESMLHRVINERLKLNPGAEHWIASCKQYGIKTMVVSGGFTLFAQHVKSLLDLDYCAANTLEIINGKLTGNILGDIVDADAKAQHLIELRNTLGLTQAQTIAIGDGANDLKMMAVSGAGVAYHAKPVVQAQATYAINLSGLEGISHLFLT